MWWWVVVDSMAVEVIGVAGVVLVYRVSTLSQTRSRRRDSYLRQQPSAWARGRARSAGAVCGGRDVVVEELGLKMSEKGRSAR